MKVLEIIWIVMVGLILPIAVMFYYVDIGWNSVRTNGENLYTMREVGVDPIHQAVPRSPAVDGATKMLKEGAAKGFKEVEAYRGVKAPG